MALRLVEKFRVHVRSIGAAVKEEAMIANLSAEDAFKRAFVTALAAIVEMLQAEGAANGEKKAAAMQLLEELYDDLAAATDIPYVPDAVADPLLKVVYMKMADFMVDSFIEWVKLPGADSLVKAFRESQ